MAVLTAQDFAQQMIAQARILDPNISGEVGTPERKIIDTVAQALSENQVDLTGLESALDIDSKYGTSLDRFISLFGFQRQQAIAATGFVIFSRNSEAPTDIAIPVNTMLQSTQVGTSGQVIQYATTAGGVISLGNTQSGPVPIKCIVPGSIGNVAANTITIIIGTNVSGVTAVTNPNAITSGVDAEDDNSLKVRFKNTWARNLAGTEAQYLALALSGTFTTKADVIGYQSRYQEYTQVPDWDDAGYVNQAIAVDPTNDVANAYSTLGTQGQWTTALSSIPYAKELYTNAQVFVSNGQTGAAQFYYRDSVDFTFNYPPQVQGDTVRGIYQTITTPGPQTPDTSTPPNQLKVQTVSGLPQSGTMIIADSTGTVHTLDYTNVDASDTRLTGVESTGGVTIAEDTPVYIIPDLSGLIRPNFTLLNVYNPSDGDIVPGLQAMAPQDIILTEFSYISSASRNTINHNVVNAVDVYVNGTNDVRSSCMFLSSARDFKFLNDPFSPWYYENYRRIGQPAKRPQENNYFMPLFQAPLDAIPDTITVNNQNFYRGYHYWLVQEVSNLGGSIRARDGIEWDKNLYGDTGDYPPPTAPADADSYLLPYNPPPGNNISDLNGHIVELDNYIFDTNIGVLQASMDGARQITTDVLVHRAKMRYFLLDITVMYSPNNNFVVVNSAIGVAVQAFFDRQYFGTVIQLSDLLEVIHEVPGVDNVRWSNDMIPIPDLIRVLETDADGTPIHGVTVDRFLTATGGTEQHSLYIVGNPTGTFQLAWDAMTTADIDFTDPLTGAPVSAATIQAAVRSGAPGSGIYHNITVAEDVRPTNNVDRPIRSFTLTYGATGVPHLPAVTQSITSSNCSFDSDFFLLDDELPSLPSVTAHGDTVPGLIIRPRAQTTFFRPGLD